MGMLTKTLKTFTRAKLLSLVFYSAMLAVAVILILAGSITFITANLVQLERGWLDTLINWIVASVTGVAGWFMLPVFVVVIAGIFQEVTIQRVEQTYYPEHTRSNKQHFWPDLQHDIRFTLKALFLNILILPTYLFGLGFLISICLNSYLLGREFFESAAGYHMGKTEARQLGRLHRKKVYSGGLIITLLTLIPIFNLLVPIFAIVWMVHEYHRIDNASK